MKGYRFCYTLPKNYSCETCNLKKGNFSMSFMFVIRIVLKSGHILTKSTPVTLYRVAPTKPAEQEIDEDAEDDDDKDK